MSDVRLLLASLLGEREVVAFRPALARELGAIPALFLCQACYWQGVKGADEWWYKLRNADRDAAGRMRPPENASRQSWEWELGLTRAEQEGARKVLCQHGLLEEQLKGVPAKLYYRVNLDRLSEFLLKNQQMAGFDQLDGRNQPTGWRDSTSKPGRIPPAITETTSEISSSTTTPHHQVVADRDMEELIEAAVWSESLSRPIKNEVGFRVKKRARLIDQGPSAEDLVALRAWRTHRDRAASEHAQHERERVVAAAREQEWSRKTKEVAVYLQSLDEASHARLVEEFAASLSSSSFVYQSYRKSGLKSKIVEREFITFVAAARLCA